MDVLLKAYTGQIGLLAHFVVPAKAFSLYLRKNYRMPGGRRVWLSRILRSPSEGGARRRYSFPTSTPRITGSLDPAPKD